MRGMPPKSVNAIGRPAGVADRRVGHPVLASPAIVVRWRCRTWTRQDEGRVGQRRTTIDAVGDSGNLVAGFDLEHLRIGVAFETLPSTVVQHVLALICGHGFKLGDDGRIALGVGLGLDDCYALRGCRIFARRAVEIAPLEWLALTAEHPAAKERTQMLGAAFGVLPATMLSVEMDAETGHETQPPVRPLG